MDKQQAQKIVDGLNRAEAAGAPVVRLAGKEQRDFNFVSEVERPYLLGSFCVETTKKFFVVVASKNDVNFQLMVFEKFKRSSVITTDTTDSNGVVWTYQAAKQDGREKNEARNKAFLEAAKSKSVVFPFPSSDIVAFSDAVNRAIALRHLADDAGADGNDDGEEFDSGSVELLAQLFEDITERRAAAALLAATVRIAHAVNPKSWCVTNPGGGEKIRVNVGVVRVLDLVPGIARLAVDGTRLDASTRETLGSALDLSDAERLAAFGDNGIAEVSAGSFGAMPDEVRVAHASLVERAASSTTPAVRHHNAEVVEEVESILGESLPRPAARTGHYWKIAPGADADQWETWREGGFIAIGWSKLGDLTNVTHDEFKGLVLRGMGGRAEENEASSQVWKFRSIEVGDRVVANNGFFRVVGIGTVTGPYHYVPNAPQAHQLPVRWDDTHERKVEMRGWRATLIRLNQETFKQIETATIVEAGTGGTGSASIVAGETEVGPEGGLDFDGVLAQLASSQLSFSAELVASYLLALQAKRFVLLSGISGTGKTRLAQEIARMFGPTVEASPVVDSDAFEIVAKPSQLKYARFIVPSVLAQEFDALTNPETNRIDLKVPGLPLASMAFHKAPERGNLMYVLLSGATKEWFTANIKVGGRFLLSKKLTGDKEWLDLALPSESRPQAALPTYELIAVRPDWTDARALLGFYNPLTKSYMATPTLRLLLRAQAEVQMATDGPPRPFFLIFDEMNLARVEHYFSDFLSVMESGEAIHLHDDPQVEEEEDVPRRIAIPKNVFVIGTVNVDETTYMFSPKVLDRAFVLEFNDVNLGGLAGPVDSEASESTPLSLVNLEGGLKLRGVSAGDEWKRFETFLGGEARALFGRIHDALAIENRHFGYRVAREVARFVDLAVEQAGTKDATVRAALDVAVLAKILPKLHGSQAEIEATLKRLLLIATGDKPENEVFAPHGAMIDGAALPLPRTARKLGRMLYRLRGNGFVSFIE